MSFKRGWPWPWAKRLYIWWSRYLFSVMVFANLVRSTKAPSSGWVLQLLDHEQRWTQLFFTMETGMMFIITGRALCTIMSYTNNMFPTFWLQILRIRSKQESTINQNIKRNNQIRCRFRSFRTDEVCGRWIQTVKMWTITDMARFYQS